MSTHRDRAESRKAAAPFDDDFDDDQNDDSEAGRGGDVTHANTATAGVRTGEEKAATNKEVDPPA